MFLRRFLGLIGLAALCLGGARGGQLNINFGSGPNDNTGETLRTFGGKAQTNFTELYSGLTTVSNLANGGSAQAKLNTNGGTVYGLTIFDSPTNAYATAGKLATFDAAKRLTNSIFADTDFPTKANNLSDLANVGTSRSNLGVDDVDSIAALRALNPANVKRYVIVGGYYARQDGGGGVFYWDSSSAVATNRGTCFQDGVPDATGRWLRVYDRLHTRFNAKWFGAKGDGSTDDTAAIADLFAQLQPNMELEIGGGFAGDTYSITALSIAKNNFTVRGKGTLKFSATNSTGVVITGNDWAWDGPNIDGNNESVGGIFVNNGNKRWAIKNSLIKNIYGDSIAGSATVAGIFVRRGCQSGLIADCTITNVSHQTNGSRVSRAISITDFGWASSADNVTGITISRCKFDTVGAGEEGDCIALNTQRTYSAGLLVSDCQGYNFGHRFGKVEGGGTKWQNNWAETYSFNSGLATSLAYSGFSFYGPTNSCNNNTVIGNLSLGVEFGSYSPTFEAYYGQANGNTVIFTTDNALTNGIGIDLTQRAYDIQADANIVYGGRYAARLQGGIQNCQFGLTLATNQFLAGFISTSDGTNAPSGCDLGNLKIEAPAASYGFNVSAGTNINVGFAHGTVATSLYNRAVGVTGSRAVEADTANSTTGKLMQFDAQLRAINAVTGLGITNVSGLVSNNIVAGSGITITAGANGQETIAAPVKFLDYKDFVYPHRVDGVGATIVTNDYTSALSGLATFAGTGGTNANYAFFRIGTIPLDLNTAVTMKLRNLAFRVSGTDTGSGSFTVSYYSPASASAFSPSDFTACSGFVTATTGTITGAGANKIFYLADITLTGWASGITAGRPFLIGIARDGTDANNDSITVVGGTIEYGRTQ